MSIDHDCTEGRQCFVDLDPHQFSTIMDIQCGGISAANQLIPLHVAKVEGSGGNPDLKRRRRRYKKTQTGAGNISTPVRTTVKRGRPRNLLPSFDTAVITPEPADLISSALAPPKKPARRQRRSIRPKSRRAASTTRRRVVKKSKQPRIARKKPQTSRRLKRKSSAAAKRRNQHHCLCPTTTTARRKRRQVQVRRRSASLESPNVNSKKTHVVGVE
ncbi:5-methyltetrahydropteroyltriglutamate--homocysteine methyltransferase [Folsomia candida]|uniref:5-methyltetrahydropteroyltriglutamate--homocysteine methyltransferase n=1 Tax=Folsomia candida TaxID=158441 RepID=A0A226D9V8_FOLCA|nr:5-methyltetrahydropteroyltriglutamate--homocysteine methyltransferase [Folsomia candida]